MDKVQNLKGFLIAIAANICKNQRRKFGWIRRIAKIVAFQDDYNNISHMKDVLIPENIVLDNEVYTLICMHYTAGMFIEEIVFAIRT